jgi:hypothetical protein
LRAAGLRVLGHGTAHVRGGVVGRGGRPYGRALWTNGDQRASAEQDQRAGLQPARAPRGGLLEQSIDAPLQPAAAVARPALLAQGRKAEIRQIGMVDQ